MSKQSRVFQEPEDAALVIGTVTTDPVVQTEPPDREPVEFPMPQYPNGG